MMDRQKGTEGQVLQLRDRQVAALLCFCLLFVFFVVYCFYLFYQFIVFIVFSVFIVCIVFYCLFVFCLSFIVFFSVLGPPAPLVSVIHFIRQYRETPSRHSSSGCPKYSRMAVQSCNYLFIYVVLLSLIICEVICLFIFLYCIHICVYLHIVFLLLFTHYYMMFNSCVHFSSPPTQPQKDAIFLSSCSLFIICVCVLLFVLLCLFWPPCSGGHRCHSQTGRR